MNTQDKPEGVELSMKARKALAEVIRLRAVIAEAEASKKEAEAILYKALVEGETGLIRGIPAVSIQGRDRKGIDTKALAEKHPAIAQAFETVSHYTIIKTA